MFALLSGLVIASLLIAAFPGEALASASGPTTKIEGKSAAALERMMKRRRAVQEKLTSKFDNAQSKAADVDAHINKFKSEGVDTTDLETAKATFLTQVASAKTFFDQAASILASPTGFGAGDKVVDLAQARITMTELRFDQSMASIILNKAMKDLTKADKKFARQHRGGK